jgi:hypothetical protein
MRDLSKRVERLEALYAEQTCVCKTQEFALVLVESGWSPERIHEAEEQKAFTCPVHGRKLPLIVHLMPGDLGL